MSAHAERAEHYEWLDFAVRDIAAAKALWSADESHIAAVLYGAQQAAEKALKALLVFEGITVPRTHDLAVLRALSGAYAQDGPDRDDLSLLTRQAAGSRYPDMCVPLDIADAQRALALAETVIADIARIIAEKENA